MDRSAIVGSEKLVLPPSPILEYHVVTVLRVTDEEFEAVIAPADHANREAATSMGFLSELCDESQWAEAMEERGFRPAVETPMLLGGQPEDGVGAVLEAWHSATRNVASLILSFLRLRVVAVDMGHVLVTGCSSQAEPNPFYDFRAASVLEPGIESCWISAPGTAVGGAAREHLDFDLCPAAEGSEPSWRRVSRVSIRIPESGPLSVRKFHVEIPHGGAWVRCSPTLETIANRGRMHPMETFQLPVPLLARRLRLVFTENMYGYADRSADAIGLWEVRFS